MPTCQQCSVRVSCTELYFENKEPQNTQEEGEDEEETKEKQYGQL